ncbi:MAG TPA: type II CAAX endopeptidase family protein [Anaerolineales bacterium]|nr:type II CAAX endopeptidase family protein [Anaerolineales bacterium]
MNWLRRNEIAVFLFLSFALSWFIWPLTLMNPNSTPMIPWGPLLSVLIVLGLTRGLAGIKSLLADMFRWRVGLRWYAFAFLVPIGIAFAAVYLNAALGAPVPPASAFAISGLLSLIPNLLITTLIAGPFTEEPGWRGFFLPRLQAKYSPLVASLIIGLIWWSWHLPLMISDPMGLRPPLQFLGLTLAFSILYTWIYNNAKASLLLLALLHGVTNQFAGFLFPHQVGEYYLRLWWVYVALWWVVMLFVVMRSSAPIKTDQPVLMEHGHQQST